MLKSTLTISLLLLIGCFHGQAQSVAFVSPGGVQCNGLQYWKLKILTDPEGRQIAMPAQPRQTSITALRKIKRPTATRPQVRWPIEKEVVRITCRIDTSGFEEDGDIHVVVKDPANGNTMVVEIPNPGCRSVKKSPFFAQIQQAFADYTGFTKTNTRFSGTYEIWGVPFFDKVHNGVGAAPTMIELHPVLRVKKLR